MNLSRKIIVLDDVLSKDECLYAIDRFNQARDLKSPDMFQHEDTFVLPISDNRLNLFPLTTKIQNSIDFLSKDVIIYWSEVVEWKFGSKQSYHKDTGRPKTVLTSITYLNDKYVGGETSFFNDLKVVPKVGRTVFFDGNYYIHGVSQISSGTRYTLPIWYKNKED